MSEQYIDIEKLRTDVNFKCGYIGFSNDLKKFAKLYAEAATAEANKRIAELQAKVSELDGMLGKRNLHKEHEYLQRMNELQASNNDLSEALEYFVDAFGYASFISDDEKESVEEVINARKLLEATPAESLAKRDDEVIEKCAKVCDEDAKQSREFAEPFAARCAELLAEAIRALKGK